MNELRTMQATTFQGSQVLDERTAADQFDHASRILTDRHFEFLDARRGHSDATAAMLESLRVEIADQSPPALLGELRDAGCLWSVVAEAIGVSDTAVRKWRRGGAIEAQHLDRLENLVALSRLYERRGWEARQYNFATWLDSRIVPQFSGTPLGLMSLEPNLRGGQLDDLLGWMVKPESQSPEAWADAMFTPAWRSESAEEQRFRIVKDAQGHRMLIIDD